MDNQKLLLLSNIDSEELMYIQNTMKDMSEQQQNQFIMIYQGKRKDTQTILFCTLAGFMGIAGIQRFLIGDIGLGVVYLFTLGFCGIGTIIDLINNKSLAGDFNRRQAFESAAMIKAFL